MNWVYKFIETKNPFGEFKHYHDYFIENDEIKITVRYRPRDVKDFFSIDLLLQFKSNKLKIKGHRYDSHIRVKFDDSEVSRYILRRSYIRDNGELKISNDLRVVEDWETFIQKMAFSKKIIIEYNYNQYVTVEHSGFFDNFNPVIEELKRLSDVNEINDVYLQKRDLLPPVKTTEGAIFSTIGVCLGIIGVLWIIKIFTQ